MTVVIPAPLDAGPPFEVEHELTVYQAAMIYAGRHPHEGFLQDGAVDDYLKFLQAAIPSQPKARERVRARRSWDIYCELMKMIKAGAISPVRSAYQRSGEPDPVRTIIKTSDLVDLAKSRRERPQVLRQLQAESQPNEPPAPKTQSPRRHGPERGSINRYGDLDRALCSRDGATYPAAETRQCDRSCAPSGNRRES
jgi:hypothetical protein